MSAEVSIVRDIGQLSAECHSIVERESTDSSCLDHVSYGGPRSMYRSILDQVSVEYRPSISRCSVDISVEYRPMYRPILLPVDIAVGVHRYFTDS